MKRKDKELLLGTVVSVASLGIYIYDVIGRKKELKKQTQLLKEIQKDLKENKCKPPHPKKCEKPLFHHPV